MGRKLNNMKNTTLENLSFNEIFAVINKLQAENNALKSEMLSLKMKLGSYKNVLGTEQEAQLAKQAAMVQNEEETLAFEDLVGPMPADIDDDFTPEMKI